MDVALCICTRNRPDDLRRALESVRHSSTPASHIIVADDSDDARTRLLVERHPLEITYLEGPRSGLGANRNHAARAATGSHVLFLDDDAELGSEFLRLVETQLVTLPPERRRKAIITGVEMKAGQTVYPNEQGLLGFQNRPYRGGETLHTVVINASLFPRTLFDSMLFDPQLRYGYDEVDCTTRAIALGYEIVPCFHAVNRHLPSAIGRDEYRPFTDASRLYVTLKRRRWTEESRLRGWIGFGLAVAHTYAASIKRSGFAGFGEARATVGQAWEYYITFVRSMRSHEGA